MDSSFPRTDAHKHVCVFGWSPDLRRFLKNTLDWGTHNTVVFLSKHIICKNLIYTIFTHESFLMADLDAFYFPLLSLFITNRQTAAPKLLMFSYLQSVSTWLLGFKPVCTYLHMFVELFCVCKNSFWRISDFFLQKPLFKNASLWKSNCVFSLFGKNLIYFLHFFWVCWLKNWSKQKIMFCRSISVCTNKADEALCLSAGTAGARLAHARSPHARLVSRKRSDAI